MKKSIFAKTGGITLLELMVVMSILAALVSISVPAFRNTFTGVEIRNEVRSLAGTLRYTQRYAVQNSVPTKLVLNKGKMEYYPQVLTDFAAKRFENIEAPGIEVRKIPDSIKIKSIVFGKSGLGSDANFVFLPDGTALDSARIIIGDGKDIEYEIKINRVTGIASYKKLEEGLSL
jgi:type II secretory pathway pseudopilin PulG